MKIASLAAVVALLTGCAGGQQMTPEQRAALMRYSQQQQVLQQQQARDSVDVYTAPARAQQAQPGATMTCTSTPMIGSVVTTCR